MTSRPRVKICGITRRDDAEAAVALGAAALGFVLWPSSPRAVPLGQAAAIVRAVGPFVATVAVLVSPTPDEVRHVIDEGGFTHVQVHGASPWAETDPAWPARLIRAVALGDAPGGVEPAVAEPVTLLLDAGDPVRHGGTGRTIDWTRAAAVAARRTVVLAGGLRPGNVREAIRAVGPAAVDVASGVESQPGIKDRDALRAFITAVTTAEEGADSCQ